ncbi:Crp/Fnr family transcriptional regulator [Streptomyces afghaniensis]|uniref:Crp/Fnr family transcriptional regulator n=1 Tax=Streptomyces afghaniensis TaxID=66865 RepID=UPI0027897570|nr:cyclic nucleotide-binding domain-containing protein [Streptomyces afghaniensis]MDQ1014343.1 CRP-like cAMP-binding protein [Streptomyces afghaniensis]
MATTTNLLSLLSPEDRDRLLKFAADVSFPAGARIFEEGSRADRFWIVLTGLVALDVRVPGRRAATVDAIGQGELLGWSWLVPPHAWQLGAEAHGPVHALEFDAAAVRTLIEEDPVLGLAITRCVAIVVGNRLQSTRTRLLDLYGSAGSGPRP